MYELIQAGESTYYMASPCNVGFYVRGGRVCLIDSGSDGDAAKKALRHIEEHGWALEMVICTHSHADHTGGCKLLKQRTGCKVYAAGVSAALIKYSYLEPTYLFGGFPMKELCSKFIMAQPCDCEELTDEALPEGLEYIHIDGHDFEQIALKTPDGVWFLADSVLSEETLSKYKISFMTDIEKHLRSLNTLLSLEGKLFIPAHCPPAEDITALVRSNIDNVFEVAETIKRLCANGLTIDELLEKLFAEFGIKLFLSQYALVGHTTKSFLSWLCDKGEIKPVFEGTRLLWQTVSPHSESEQ